MSDCCDQFSLEEFADNFDMGINFLVGPPTPSEVIFIPHVDAAGNLSWTNDGGLPNPETVNIKGPAGDQVTVNGVPVTSGTDNIELHGTEIPVSSSDNTTISEAVSAVGKNPFAGKKVGFWGDSIQYGLLGPNLGNLQSEYNYPAVFGRLTGADVENNAISGASICNYDSNSFINRVDNIVWTDYDYAVLDFGRNDVGHGETIANIKSAFNTCIGKMYAANPSLKIVLCSPAYSTNLTGRYPPSNINLQDVYYIIRDVAQGNNCLFVDFLYGAGITYALMSTLAWDGLHFKDAGYEKLGEYLAACFAQPVGGTITTYNVQKLRLVSWGGTSGAEIYIYGQDNSVYTLVLAVNSFAIRYSLDGGATWTTVGTWYPST